MSDSRGASHHFFDVQIRIGSSSFISSIISLWLYRKRPLDVANASGSSFTHSSFSSYFFFLFYFSDLARGFITCHFCTLPSLPLSLSLSLALPYLPSTVRPFLSIHHRLVLTGSRRCGFTLLLSVIAVNEPNKHVVGCSLVGNLLIAGDC